MKITVKSPITTWLNSRRRNTPWTKDTSQLRINQAGSHARKRARDTGNYINIPQQIDCEYSMLHTLGCTGTTPIIKNDTPGGWLPGSRALYWSLVRYVRGVLYWVLWLMWLRRWRPRPPKPPNLRLKHVNLPRLLCKPGLVFNGWIDVVVIFDHQTHAFGNKLRGYINMTMLHHLQFFLLPLICSPMCSRINTRDIPA